jgi:hypothetical protein
MKRTLAVILAALTAAALTGCGGNGSSGSGQNAGNSAAAPAAESSVPANADGNAKTSAVVTDGSKCGVLQKVTDQNDFELRGLILTTGSGHHNYPSVEDQLKDGYKTEGLCSTYYLNEWFEIYADCDKAVNIYVVQNQPDADYAAMTEADLQKIDESAAYSNSVTDAVPDAENNGQLWSTYVNGELDAGLYNICFVSGGKLCYLVQITLEPETETAE